MLEGIKGILTFMFGTNAHDRWHRIVMFTLIVIIAINMIFNISFGFSEKCGWSFNWKGIDAKVELKK